MSRIFKRNFFLPPGLGEKYYAEYVNFTFLYDKFILHLSVKATFNIQNKLKLYRVMAGNMTQQDLAERVGTTRQTIVSIEKGRYSPSVGLALQIAQALNTTVDELFKLETGDDHA